MTIKSFPGTDIPDALMLEVGVLLTGGSVKLAEHRTVHEVAARVLMLERERCASLAKAEADNPFNDAAAHVARRIEHAITAGNLAGTQNFDA